MNNGSYSASKLRTEQVPIRSGFLVCWSKFRLHCNLRYLSVAEKMSRRAHYETLSEFERVCIIELKKVGWANRRIARHMGRIDAAIRRCRQELVENGRF
ncbi:hypothetical protein TNCV_3953571 [Trichonephila clavipes]|nr:hypothetical protein TNCV_3953571 [Trichonephila clavipes]